MHKILGEERKGNLFIFTLRTCAMPGRMSGLLAKECLERAAECAVMADSKTIKSASVSTRISQRCGGL